MERQKNVWKSTPTRCKFMNTPNRMFKSYIFLCQVEDTLLREQIEQYNSRLRAYEDRQRHFREEQDRQAEAEAEVVQALLNISEKQ